MENGIAFCHFLSCGIIFPQGLNFSHQTFVFKCKNIYPSHVMLDFVAERSEKILSLIENTY